MSCPQGKKCKSKCGDTVKFTLSDQGSSVCKNFKLLSLLEEGRKHYKLDQHQCICSNNHVITEVEVEKKPSLVVCARKHLMTGYMLISLSD